MTTAAGASESRALRRRIIERPRLFALLDESTARVRTLVAPAGYGKTTLAEQWVRRDGRTSAWYTARRSSTDVAALALGVARVASEVVPECDARLREHLRAVPNPGEHVDVLAEILGEDLAEWPPEAWLVFDDYQELVAAAEAERFVEELLGECPLQLLITSRQRPSWVTARSILYGEVLELSQTVLAMDSQEAAQVLPEGNASSASGLVALANGWPAVIGLAAVTSAEIEGEHVVPETLYRFFAEEVFDALGENVRTGLATLVIAPVLDRELAGELLGADPAEAVISAALDVGIVVERAGKLEIHPLARSFLEERSEQRCLVAGPETIAKCLDRYRARREWDAAFDLIARHGLAEDLEPLLVDALDDLLNTARLSTIETWCALAAKSGLDRPIFFVARAELSLRQGHHAEAQTFAEVAAKDESELSFRALSVGGRAAHLASREEDALEFYSRAEAAARTKAEQREALWGRAGSLIDLERTEAVSTLEELTAEAALGDARDVVRAAGYRMYLEMRFGRVDLAEADVAAQVLPAVDDPLVESGFMSAYSGALALSARYDEALEVASALLSMASRYRFDFAVPYALCQAAVADAGLRKWQQAEDLLRQGAAAARAQRDVHAERSCFCLLLRVLAQQGHHQTALTVHTPPIEPSIPSSRAEVMCSQALVLALLGRLEDARALIHEGGALSRAVEPTMLVPAVEAVIALKSGDDRVLDRVAELEEACFSSGALDILVTAYRAAPDLLAILLRASRNHERIVGLVRKARDEDLAGAVGHPIAIGDDPRLRLSRREREVYDLICHGLTNRQIAELLFISESTVKVHAHHIYDKLGTRSRTALAVQAALGRADQATSAMGESDVEAAS